MPHRQGTLYLQELGVRLLIRVIEIDGHAAAKMREKGWMQIQSLSAKYGRQPPVMPRTAHTLLIYRYKHEAILHDDRILLIGGGAPFPVEDSTLETIYELNLSSHKWRKIKCKGSLPDGRRSHACQLYNNCTLWSAGGGAGAEGSRLYLHSWFASC